MNFKFGLLGSPKEIYTNILILKGNHNYQGIDLYGTSRYHLAYNYTDVIEL